MKNLYESETVDEIIARINSLQPAAQRQWGKMDVGQMLEFHSERGADATVAPSLDT